MVDPGFELVIVDGRPAVRGECDLSTAADIENWLESFGTRTLEVDLSGVTFIDSSGLNALLNARRRNPHLRVVEPSRVVARLFEITGTHEHLVLGGPTSES